MDRRRSPAAARSALAVVLLLAAAGALAQDRGPPPPEVRLSTAQGPAFALGKAGERWAQLVNERSERAFEVRTFPGAVLAGRDAGREFGALRDGMAEMAVGSALAWSSQLPVFGAYVLPWLAPEAREQAALAADAALLDLVAASAARSGVVVLVVAPLGERVLATARDAVRAPADAAGLAVRVIPNQLVIETFAALGARPESLDFAQAQTAFAAGRLGGQEAAASTLAATRAAAAGLRFVTRWGAFADQMVFAVRRATWESWSDAQRAAVRAAAVDAAREAAAPVREDAALAELTRQGVTIVTPTPAQRAAFRAAVQPVWARWAAVVGTDAARAAESAVAAAPGK
ncbi:MAG: TRAP transporter substrate-binding protein DctP [Burkholderiales bacterium]|nr:TRAP transporter substrate-binding protein DctP [Burkholderiales bacterium]